MTVIVVAPEPETFALVTSIISTVLLSDDFLIMILPVLTTTSSLKVRMMLALMSTPVAPSDGEDEDKVGAVRSVESAGELHVMKVPPLASEVPPTVISKHAVSHVPEVMVKLLSMSIAFVACVAEVPLRTTL